MKIPEPTAKTSPAGNSVMLGRKNANTFHLDEMGSCATLQYAASRTDIPMKVAARVLPATSEAEW
jgi:hypothetical protein